MVLPNEPSSLQPVVVVPVRILLGRQPIQSTTRVLTAESAFVHALSRPPAGLRVPVRLYLPSGPPEDLLSMVVNRPPPEGESGFWVDFVAISASTRARLDSLVASKRAAALAVAAKQGAALAGKQGGAVAGKQGGAVAGKQAGGAAGMASGGEARAAPAPVMTSPLSRPRVTPPVLVPEPPPPARAEQTAANLRSTQRVPANLRVRFQTAAALKEEISVNVSAGGMFIRTDAPPPLREIVKVSIELPGEAQPIETQAQVVHRVTREEGRLTGRAAGAGVQFVEADDRFRETLDAWLAKTQL
jgi:uncharacterized protein (TIGR02266 family)